MAAWMRLAHWWMCWKQGSRFCLDTLMALVSYYGRTGLLKIFQQGANMSPIFPGENVLSRRNRDGSLGPCWC